MPDFQKKKKNGGKFGPNGTKSGPQLGFLLFSQVWFIVFLEIAYNNTVQQFLTSIRGKIYEKKFGGPNLGQRDQNWAQN